MNVQWYPGHMTKAKRQMQEDIKLIDLMPVCLFPAETRILMNLEKTKPD